MIDHYYELKYVYEGRELMMKFHAGIDIDTMVDSLQNFLRGAGWSEDHVKKIFGLEWVMYAIFKEGKQVTKAHAKSNNV